MKILCALLVTGLCLTACRSDNYVLPNNPGLQPPLPALQQNLDSTYNYLFGSKAVGIPASKLFGNKPDDGIRLVQVLRNGKPVYEYAYDAQNRLTEAKTFGGGFTLWATRYTYDDATFSTTADFFVNVAEQNGFMTLNSNTLKPKGTTRYAYNAETGLATLTNGNLVQFTGFNAAGYPRWTEENSYSFYETPAQRVKRARSSTLYDRDANGNMLKSTITYDGGSTDQRVYVTTYTYDDKRSPYANQSPNPGTIVGPANALTAVERSGNSTTTRTYTYLYRPDGYPASQQVKTVVNNGTGQTETTDALTFVYNR